MIDEKLFTKEAFVGWLLTQPLDKKMRLPDKTIWHGCAFSVYQNENR